MAYVEKKIRMKVEMSEDKQKGIDIYRIWDIDCQIPKPKDVAKVEIRINTNWEKMYFNKVWGSCYDPTGEGCWLKQKRVNLLKHKRDIMTIWLDSILIKTILLIKLQIELYPA